MSIPSFDPSISNVNMGVNISRSEQVNIAPKELTSKEQLERVAYQLNNPPASLAEHTKGPLENINKLLIPSKTDPAATSLCQEMATQLSLLRGVFGG